MEKQRKTYKFLLTVMFMVVCFMIPCITSNTATIVDQGVDGDLKWSIDSDGHFLIEGVGDYEGDEYGDPTWHKHAYNMKSATVKVSGITDCSYFFFRCEALKTIDLSEMDTSQVTNMKGMFGMCSNAVRIDVSGFDTSNVTKMGGMFANCFALTELDLSSFDMSKVEGYDGEVDMFFNMDSASLGRIKTPKNVKENVTLPANGTWKTASGTVYTALPKNKSNSIWLYNIGTPTKLVTRDGKKMIVDEKGVRIAKTGLVKLGTTLYYVKDGYICNDTTLVKYNNKYYYVKGGKHVKATTLVTYGGKKCYVKNGIWEKVIGLVKYSGEYWYIKSGVVCNDTTLVKNGSKYYLVYRGKWYRTYNGSYTYNGVRWKIVNGVVDGRA